ncbi:MAG: hypothetical protein KC503_47095 [Myxococcales bacterium]|nr:hypothetical protein [Myxococcales bacterium]
MRFKQYLRAFVAVAVLAIAASSCGDSKAPSQPLDTNQVTSDITIDSGQQQSDITIDGQAPPADQYVWPDTNTTDTWPQQNDLYAGSPFGCQTNADCFGQSCCPTPWGVKLCAPSCGGQ